jgi:hypothetical protein
MWLIIRFLNGVADLVNSGPPSTGLRAFFLPNYGVSCANASSPPDLSSRSRPSLEASAQAT